jgi:WD40 repeat protein
MTDPTNQEPTEPTSEVVAEPTKTHLATTWKFDRPLTACRFDPSGRYVFAGTEDYSVQRFARKDGTATPLVGHESWCRAIAFTPDGATTVTGGYDGRLLWWRTDAERPEPLRAVAAHDGWIRAVAISRDGRLVATCGNDRLVKLWNTADGRIVRTLAGHESHVYNLAFHPDGKALVSTDLHGVFKHWNLRNDQAERTFQIDGIYKYDKEFRSHHGGARSLAFNGDGSLLGAGGTTNLTNALGGVLEGAMYSIDWDAGKLRVMHVGKSKPRGEMWGLRWHADGYWCGMSAGRDTILLFWKPDEAQDFSQVKAKEIGRDFDLHPNGLEAAVAMAESQLCLFRLTDTEAAPS